MATVERPKLVLHKETLRALQDSDLKTAAGGAARQQTPTILATVCGFDPPPWVSTSPPTHLCY